MSKNPQRYQTKADAILVLECPVCFILMSGKISRCVSGHSFCDGCCRLLQNCPICKKKFIRQPNAALQKMYAEIIKQLIAPSLPKL